MALKGEPRNVLRKLVHLNIRENSKRDTNNVVSTKYWMKWTIKWLPNWSSRQCISGDSNLLRSRPRVTSRWPEQIMSEKLVGKKIEKTGEIHSETTSKGNRSSADKRLETGGRLGHRGGRHITGYYQAAISTATDLPYPTCLPVNFIFGGNIILSREKNTVITIIPDMMLTTSFSTVNEFLRHPIWLISR